MPDPAYFDMFDKIKFRRVDGILEMQLHTDGREVNWGGGSSYANKQIEHACELLTRDTDNGVVIITGTGSWFSGPEIPKRTGRGPGLPQLSGRPWDVVFDEVHRLMFNTLNIPVPVIAAINGPVTRHCEWPMMADILLATEDAYFQDSAHFTAGLVPGDGKHVLFPMLMGINRARYFMLTGAKLHAAEALQIGLVHEILPREQLLDRAWALARDVMEQPPQVRRYTRRLLTEKMRREMHEYLSMGMGMEGLGIWGETS